MIGRTIDDGVSDDDNDVLKELLKSGALSEDCIRRIRTVQAVDRAMDPMSKTMLLMTALSLLASVSFGIGHTEWMPSPLRHLALALFGFSTFGVVVGMYALMHISDEKKKEKKS